MRICRYLLMLFTLCTPYLSHPFDFDDSDPMSEMSDKKDFNLDDFDDVPDTTVTRQESTPCDILDLLYGFKAHDILAEDLYRSTYPLPSRNILKNPLLFNFTPQKSQFNFSVFYQQATNLFACCNGIDNYLNLFDAQLIRKLDVDIAQAAGLDIPAILPLFKNAFVEQRRVGFYFGGWKRFKSLSFGLEVPLYLVERNYNFLPEDQQEIQESIIEVTANLGQKPNELTEDEQAAAVRPYVLETRFGLGDTRLTIGWDAINCDRFRLTIGPKIIFPTATTLASGFFASDFKHALCRPSIDLEDLIDKLNAGNTAATKQADLILTQVVNQLGALTLATDLGEDKRLQVGFYIQPVLRVDKKVSLLASLNANWQLGHRSCRYIIEQQNLADFADANFDPENLTQDECSEALAFLSRRLENVLFPCNYRVRLLTQFEGQLTAGARIMFTDNWSSIVGYDYWRKDRECARGVYQGCTRINNLNTIKLPHALVGCLVQHKLFLKIGYTKYKENHNFTFSFGADLPILSKGISDDYTGYINFEWAF